MAQRCEIDYRLGNIIDAWYGQQHVPRRQGSNLALMTHRNHGTFGNFLSTHKPIKLVLDCTATQFYKDAGSWWWCYDYGNYKTAFPCFNESLRHAIAAFEPFRNLPTASTADTCVVHFRLGDFVKEAMISIDDLVGAAMALLPRTPDRFEILNGGSSFRVTSKLKAKSDELLSKLASSLQQAFPNARVEMIYSDNADADFYRMVMAPMLLTGPGSFAICAAAANKNHRLTPALANLNFPKYGPSLPHHVYEDWYTYPCRNLRRT